MDVKTAYNSWSQVYDSNENKTRDLEGVAIQAMLRDIIFQHCLEIGCGTGKNTLWLRQQAQSVIAVDISDGMLAKAKLKIISPDVIFKKADVTQPWDFAKSSFDMITFSLVLEHIVDLDFIFQQAARVIVPGGFLYLGELHPYKQYLGTKARFETKAGIQVVECYNHHISEFTHTAGLNGFRIHAFREFFDFDDKIIPRILAIVFQKK